MTRSGDLILTLVGLALLGLALPLAATADPPAPVPASAPAPLATAQSREGTMPFHRVRVPGGRLGEVPLGGHRLVPVPVEEFEAALAAATGDARLDETPPALRRQALTITDATCTATLDVEGRLRGTVSFDLPADDLPSLVSLGMVPILRGSCDGEGMSSDVAIHGGPSALGFLATKAGHYRFQWEMPPAEDGGALVLPLVPALRTRIELKTPPGTVALIEGEVWARQPVAIPAPQPASGAESVWRIDVGPIETLLFTAVPAKESARQFGCWQAVAVGQGEVGVTAVIVPTTPWRTLLVSLDADPRLLPVSATVALPSREGVSAEVEWGRAGEATLVRLPAGSLGTLAPLSISAVAPLPHHGADGPGDSDDGWLPLIWPVAAEWAGGGVRVECDSGLSLIDIGSEHCLPVAAEKTAGWPIRPGAAGEGALVALEAQSPQARVRVGVAPRGADLDVARVTTVDIVPTVVTGRTACDLRVRSGEAFEVTGQITPGWFIDAVEAVERRGDRASVIASLDWRVVRDGRGDRLRIGFPTAATPQRGFTLSIAGHRAGIATEEPFTGAEMDMVRLDGEAAGLAVLALTSPPETTIELDPPLPPPASPPERLAALTAKTAIRAWIPVDDAAMTAPASLLQRRPPVEADTHVRLTVVDERITESFTFSCRPGASPLDAVVVHFSEPTEDLLEWSLLPSAGGTLTVRRIDRNGGAGGGGESWLVELQPAARGEVRFRAVRAVPFGGPVAVPLAWVDGSDPQQGGVVIVNAGRRRPLIVNRRLEEMPPAGRSGDDDAPKGTLAEFAFTPPTDPTPAVTPAAEIFPGGRDREDEARAWVWNEETTCWCHPTGVTEYETRFEIENHGRTSVAVMPPLAALARGVVIDGVPATVVPDVMTGAWLVDLPADRRFIRLVVRSEISAPTRPIAWDVALAGAGIDVPVLERTWQVLLPDGVDIAALPAGFREVGAARTGWLERLLPVTVRGRSAGAAAADAPRSRQGTIDAGFRERILVQLAGRGQGMRVRLVHSRWLWGSVLLVCVAFATFGFLTASRVTRLLVAVGLAIAALWLPLPLDGLGRAGLWGLAVAALLRWATARWRTTLHALPVALAIIGFVPTSVAAQQPKATVPTSSTAADQGGESLPVFIVPGLRGVDEEGGGGEASGETALVPEPLYRVLSAALGQRAADGVRIHAVRLRALPGTEGAWTLSVDLDAEAGALITMRQDGEASWDPARPRVDGEQVAPTADSDERLLRVGFASAGRHRLEAGVLVRPTHVGEVDRATVSIPFAPTAELVVEGPLPVGRGDAAVLQVETVGSDGLPRRVRRAEASQAAAGAIDISRATRVRLAWASDGGTRIVDTIPVAESRNDLFWDDDGCRLAATYALDPGDQIVRGAIVRADPRLGFPVLTEPGFTLSALGGGRFLVEVTTPRRGRIAFAATFVMPLADPVGVFDLPSAWLESVASDARTTRLEPAPELIVKTTLPEDATLLPPRSGSGATGGMVWRSESGRGVRQAEFEGASPGGLTRPRPAATVPARVSVERRRQPPRGNQRMEVGFTADAVRLRLEARIDAAGAPLVAIPVEVPEGCDIERVTLRDDPTTANPSSDNAPIGVRWRRDGPRRILVVVQRPRPGAFLLDVAVHLHGAPAATGTLPLLRAALEPVGPLTVTWRMAEGFGAVIGGEATGSEAPRDSVASSGSYEVAADAPPPPYRIVARGPDENAPQATEPELEPADATASPAPGDAALGVAGAPGGGPRVEFAETHLAVDARGRAWGVSRFDVIAADPTIRIRIPTGMRMFDVFVDGRIANDAVPARTSIAENAWELRLLDVGWPRSIVAVYAGDVSDGLPVDGVLEIPEPSIVGLSCLRSAWVVELPEGIVARPLPPATAVDEETMMAARRAAIEGLAGEFERAIARAAPDDARRLADFLKQRRREAVLPLPAAWSHVGMRDSHAAAAWAPPLRLLEDQDIPSLRLVVARRADASMPGRLLATAVMLLGVVVLLEARRRTRIVSRLVSALLGPWWVVPLFVIGLGALWIATLDPVWPGWLAVCAGAATVTAWMPRESQRWFRRTFAAGGEPPWRSVTGETVTRLGPVPRSAASSRRPTPSDGSGSTVRPGN